MIRYDFFLYQLGPSELIQAFAEYGLTADLSKPFLDNYVTGFDIATGAIKAQDLQAMGISNERKCRGLMQVMSMMRSDHMGWNKSIKGRDKNMHFSNVIIMKEKYK